MKILTSAQLADHIHVRYLYKIKTFPMLPDGYCYFQSLCNSGPKSGRILHSQIKAWAGSFQVQFVRYAQGNQG